MKPPDAPDYSSCTEAQARQALKDSALQNFPERLEAARQRLVYLENAKAAVIPRGRAMRQISKTLDPRNSRQQLLMHAMTISALVLFALIHADKRAICLVLALGVAAVGLHGYMRDKAYQLEVFDFGDALGFRAGQREAYVSFHDIDWVEVNYAYRKRWLVIHLKFESALGTELAFYPSDPGPSAKQLCAQLRSRLPGRRTSFG